MKRILPLFLRSVICIMLLCSAVASRASHIVGADLFYTHITGLQYKVTVILYGDCGPSSSAAFSTLPSGTPRVCVFNGPTFVTNLTLAIEAPAAGVEITPVCPAYVSSTQCTNPSFATPGIKKFVYSTNVTLPSTSAVWRFVFNGNHGSSTGGRAAAITNLAGGSTIQLIDTLNNVAAPNNSPQLTVVPTPFFCKDKDACYNPGAVDADLDSLRFSLIQPTNGTTGCTAVGGPVAYTTAFPAWPGQPITAATPLQVVSSSYSFDPVTGQLCFNPNFLQRSVVVYNVREYRGSTMVGTSQREMTFLVIDCPSTAPESGAAGLTGGIIETTSNNFEVCGNEGWGLTFNPTADDPTLNITVTATGYAGTGISFVVTGNGTPTPVVSISGTPGLAPGDYTIFMSFRDNYCPLNGLSNKAVTIKVLPVPKVNFAIVTPANCTDKAYVSITPGGTGKPWRMKVRSPDPSLIAPADTIFTAIDSETVYTYLAPSDDLYTIKIFADGTNKCPDTEMVYIPRDTIRPRTSFVSPTYCGANDGYITIHGLTPFSVDTIRYDRMGIPQPTIIGVAAGDSTIPITGLKARTYSSFVIKWGYCVSPVLPPVTLVNPPFTWSRYSFKNPTKCGFCDGMITLHGLHPGQNDSLFYNFNATGRTEARFIGADSTIVLSGLCKGAYSSFIARTDTGCETGPLGPLNLTYDTITAQFDTTVRYGCHGDTVYFTNTSLHNSVDTVQYYTWFFGDGTTSNEENPVHVYTNSATDTVFTVKLIMTNTKCIDSTKLTITLRNYIHADFSITPDNFTCTNVPVTITNGSIGGNPDLSVPLAYQWLYRDGNNSNDANPTHEHSFTKSGTYNIMLVASNMIPCFDTAYRTIVIDSPTSLDMIVTDTVICRGQAINFSGLYSRMGNGRNDSTVRWNFGNGFTMMNANPVYYTFDEAGDYDVTVEAYYRACRDTAVTRRIKVFSVPSIYLGPDTSICIGSAPITLRDMINATNPKARWSWNDETVSGPSMVITKPGFYHASVSVDGCSNSDTVWVANDCYISIPNVFTPNGDGLNDYFFPRQLLARGLTTFTMTIYNRWGQVVYEAKSAEGKGWDGKTADGKEQPQGVYVYQIDVKFKDGQIERHTGNVTIMR